MKYYVKCTGYKRSEDFFTIGKIYEVDGGITNDNGYRYTDVSWQTALEFLADWYTFERVECSKKIVITTDGVETLARLYDGKKVVKSATAKCSPDDEFDFEFGAKLALDRLSAMEAKKESQFKVGDIVRIGKAPHKKPANIDMRKYAGEYGRVVEVDCTDSVFVKMFVDKDQCRPWYWHVDDVELIERNEK